MLSALARVVATACLVAFVVPRTTPTIIVPNFRDLTIKTRERIGTARAPTFQTHTWFFKGARVRNEYQDQPQPNQPPPKLYVMLTQCDKKAHYSIDEMELEYEKSSITEIAERERDLLIGAPGQGQITITYKSVDMGGRHRIGSYEARHIATTITFDPSEDAGIQPAEIDLDGWYIDLPGWDRCEDWPGTLAWALELTPNHPKPRFILRWHGPRRGFIVDETSRVTGRVQTEAEVAFVGIDENPIDRSLFEVPKDYVEHPH
jgi:hypothetical protein